MLEGHFGPVTQSLDAIKSLLAYVGRASDPMPSEVSMDNGRLMLVLSNKKDAYYTVTEKKCSCPARVWHPGTPCKHQRKYFGASMAPTVAPTSEPLVKRGGFKPFDEMPGEEMRAAKASSLSAIDCHDTRDIDVAYHSINEDRIMWAALGEA
jgi:hypothetical protein